MSKKGILERIREMEESGEIKPITYSPSKNPKNIKLYFGLEGYTSLKKLLDECGENAKKKTKK